MSEYDWRDEFKLKAWGGCAVARLIDADEIMKALSIFNDTTNGNSHFLNGIETAKELIEDAPTADPVLHAEWLYDRPGHWFCSNCHLTEGWASKWMKYCPLCGAKMDKENCDE